MRNLIQTVIVAIIGMFLLTTVHAEEVTNAEGKKAHKFVTLKVYPQTFTTKEEAEKVASTLSYGDVYRDVDTKKYQVIYGNARINDIVVLSSMTEVK